MKQKTKLPLTSYSKSCIKGSDSHFLPNDFKYSLKFPKKLSAFNLKTHYLQKTHKIILNKKLQVF